MQPDALRRAASVWRTLGIIIGQSVAQSLAINPHYRHQPSVRLVIRQGIKEANAPFEGAKCVFEARLLRCLAVIHTKVARCAQLGFVEALCTSGDDQRPDKWPAEASRGDQRRSEAIRGDQRRSEAIRSQQRPSEAIGRVVKGHQRGRRGGAPPNVPPRVALARPRRRERSSRPD
jgi:hypothetical protein